MKEDSIIKIFRTRIASTALQTFRDKKILNEIKNKNELVSELCSLFTELESKYNLLTNEQVVQISIGDLSALLQSKVSKESISFIGNLVTLDNDDTLISLENCMATLLEIFHVTIDKMRSKEHINYFTYCHIEYIMFTVYGLYCNETKEHQSKSFLEKITERPLHGFFDTFILEDYLVNSFVDGIVPLEILKQNRGFAYEDTANRYLENISRKTDDEIIDNLDSFLTSSGILPINDIFYILSRNLLKQEKLGLWISFMMKMEIPVLQNELLFTIDDYTAFEQIVDYILQNNGTIPHVKIVLALLRKRWLDCLIENTKNIKDSVNIKDINDDEKTYIEKANSDWEAMLEKGISIFVKQNLKVFSSTAFSKWCLKKSIFDNSRKTTQSAANNIVIAGVWDCLLQHVCWKDLDTSNSDYRFILFCISSYLKEEKIAEGKLMELSKDMETAIGRDDFIWSMNLDETSLKDMRCWLNLISLLNKRYPMELLGRNLTIWEGYNTTPLKGIYKQQRRESFVMSTLALLFEKDDYFESDKEKSILFEYIARCIIKQCRCCVFERDILQYYYQPLLILELVANQILTGEKDWYNLLLLKELDDFRVLLRVLTDGNAVLTEESSRMLAVRKSQEWMYIRATMEDLAQTKREIPFYEEKMVKLGI